MDDQKTLKKYNSLVSSVKYQASRSDEADQEFKNNTTIAIMYVKANIDDIKSYSRKFMKIERCSSIMATIQSNIGVFDKTLVYKELRKHGIIDFFDILLIICTIYIWIVFIMTYINAVNVPSNLYIYCIITNIFFIILMKFSRYVHNC